MATEARRPASYGYRDARCTRNQLMPGNHFRAIDNDRDLREEDC